MVNKLKQINIWIILILFFGFGLRLYGMNWDSGFHFHPDERMLIMVAERIQFWTQLNPDFFNYGSLPIYLLKGTSQLIDLIFKSNFANYDGMLIVGRILSTSVDLIVILLIYKLAYFISHKKDIALWSSFIYATAFFAIQNSHFFIVDTFLNLFSTLLIYLLLLYHEKPSYKKIVFIGIIFAASITTKVSAVIFLPVVGLTLLFPTHNKFKNVTRYTLHVLRLLLLFTFSFLLFSFVFMPFAFIEKVSFIHDLTEQVRMNSDAYVFPYTLQYIGTVPYLYYLKNIFLWGFGPIYSFLAFLGILFNFRKFLTQSANHKNKKIERVYTIIIFGIFYLLYFLVIGKSAVKFMRYMLLMYPLFAIMAGYGVSRVTLLFGSPRFGEAGGQAQSVKRYTLHVTRPQRLSVAMAGVARYTIIFAALLWTLMFLNIYSYPNTRIQATNWINQYIPAGSTLAVEHWDDRVPIFDPGKYQYEELPLYDIPDDYIKWKIVNEKLNRSDYIVIASNRLYTPLQRLNDCKETYPRCYPITSVYYEKLLSNKGDFVKIAEFTSYPKFSSFKFQVSIIDDSADESFTVYDHPKIMIFKRKDF